MLNMIIVDQKTTENDIPAEYYLLDQDESKWVGYFYFEEPKTMSFSGKSDSPYFDIYMECVVLSVLHSTLEKAVKLGYVSKIQDYISCVWSFSLF